MRVLVADDEPAARVMLGGAVAAMGHMVLTAEDGERAWQLCQDERPDILLLDGQMPGLSGVELTRMVRTLSGFYPFIIIVSATDGFDPSMAGIHAGADEYLVKPPKRRDLLRRFAVAWRITQLHKRLHDHEVQLELLNQQLYLEGRTDPLTGVRNRLAMKDDFPKFRASVDRYGDQYSVAICDIDFFKNYNDTLGHLAGDAALVRVAASLQAACRATDHVYRFGGEEFLMIFREPVAKGRVAAERMRAAVSDLALEHPGVPLGRVTISVGVAQLASHAHRGLDAVLGAADAALYRAKETGRNRVIVDGD